MKTNVDEIVAWLKGDNANVTLVTGRSVYVDILDRKHTLVRVVVTVNYKGQVSTELCINSNKNFDRSWSLKAHDLMDKIENKFNEW